MAVDAARKKHDPWATPDYTPYDAGCIKALSVGLASSDQQVHALRFVVETLASTYDQSFRPGGAEADRSTIFAEGRRFVGMQLVKLTKVNMRST